MSGLLTAVGIAAAAGFNVPLTLLLAGLAARLNEDFSFTHGLDWLESTWLLLAVGAWLLVELAVDKLPGPGRVNNLVNAPLRPAAAALVFAGTSSPFSDGHAWLGAVAGASVGIGVSLVKSRYRRRLANASAVLAYLSASLAEDLLVAAAILLAVFAPPLGAAAAILGVVAAASIVFRGVGQAAAPRPPEAAAS